MLSAFCLFLVVRCSLGAPTENLKGNDPRPLCPCGANSTSLNTRVVGGHDIGRNTFPFASGLLYHSSFFDLEREMHALHPFCGGTLITDRHIVTAAHCLRDKTADVIYVDVGDYSLKNDVDGRIIPAVRITKHPDYVPETFYSDIGVVELAEPVPFESGLRSSWLAPDSLELAPGTTVHVFGWGRLNYSGGSPDKLQSVDLPVVDYKDCKEKFVTKIETNMLCAGGEVGKDACIGDSGGGLVVRLDNEYVLVGVVSFGKQCALPGVPGVYSKVSSFVNWVLEQTTNAGCRPCVYGQ